MEATIVKKKKVRKLSIFTRILIVIFFIVISTFLCINISNYRTLSSLQKINDYPFYTMTYEGDYPLELFVKLQDIAFSRMLKNSIEKNISMDDNCTCFMSPDNSGGYLYGRNLDSRREGIGLLLFTKPKNKYASVSMVELGSLGYSSETSILGSRLPDMWVYRTNLLLAPYVPRDGMNECGLVVSTLNVPHSEVTFDNKKITVSRWQATRLMLDHAANVDEAISLLSKYNIYTGPSGLHYLLADSSGDSAIVEFLDGKIEVVRSDDTWQVASNFIAAKYEAVRTGQDRFDKANDYLKKMQGNISEKEAMNILEIVSQSGTVWSSLYNMTTGKVSISNERDYENIYTCELKMKTPSQ